MKISKILLVSVMLSLIIIFVLCIMQKQINQPVGFKITNFGDENTVLLTTYNNIEFGQIKKIIVIQDNIETTYSKTLLSHVENNIYVLDLNISSNAKVYINIGHTSLISYIVNSLFNWYN